MVNSGSNILAINMGSSSGKFRLYLGDVLVAKGSAERIFQDTGRVRVSALSGPTVGKGIDYTDVALPDHKTALDFCLKALMSDELQVLGDPKEIDGVGHRFVHGGASFRNSVVINGRVLEMIKDVSGLAPLHNPANLDGYSAARILFPEATHVAVFDTAFHSTMPDFAYRIAVPREYYERYGVRKYGFHGTSHSYVSRVAAILTGMDYNESNCITMHMGNGISMCNVERGRSVDTTMGLTPLAGPMMGTRSGDVEPAVLAYILAQDSSLTMDELVDILNKKSGALAISGKSMDWRDIQAGAKDPSDPDYENCNLAINMFTNQMRKFLGAYLVAPLDENPVHSLVFTAGIGENEAYLRQRIVEKMERFDIKLDRSANDAVRGPNEPVLISTEDSKVHIFVIPTDEEEMIRRDTEALLGGVVPDNDFVYPFQKDGRFSKIVH